METSQIIWAALVVVFLTIEAVTAGLASVWFALGALVALVLSFFAPEQIVWQVVLFIIVTAVTVYFTRPLAMKYLNNKTLPTNADRVIGKTAQVISRISNIEGVGEVSVDGRIWSARGEGQDIIEAGSLVKVMSISGVKLFVCQVETQADIKNKEAAGT